MVELTTKIITATLYPDWVRITRQGSIHLDSGTHSIEVSGLPRKINKETLRVTVFGSGNPRLLGVKLKLIRTADQLLDRAGQLEEEIEKTQDELKQLDDKTGLIKQNRSILDKLASQTETYASALATGEMSIEKQIDALNKLRAQEQILDEEIHSIQITYRERARQLEELKRELEEVHIAVPHESYTAVVDVELSQKVDLTIELSYVEEAVSWTPVYELRLLEKDDNPSLEVSYMADVTQNCGEDWEDISLTLSTARPALSLKLPDLDPWFIHLSKPSAFDSPDLTQSSAQTDEAPRLPGNQPDTRFAHQKIKSEELTQLANDVGTSVSYVITYPVSIPSDNLRHKVIIARFLLMPELEYLSTPKLSQAIYRQARIENNSIYTLLPGKANLIIGDEYVGITSIELTVPGEKIELFLGSDNRIKVERELKRRDVDRRLSWGKRHLVLAYEITVESMLHHKAIITIYDQMPMPDHEDIKVKLESADPKPLEQNKLNQLMWLLELEPKEKQTIRFDYSIDSPQGMNITGLP
jgi:uncharacterized protein (TIGR02231 family)